MKKIKTSALIGLGALLFGGRKKSAKGGKYSR